MLNTVVFLASFLRNSIERRRQDCAGPGSEFYTEFLNRLWIACGFSVDRGQFLKFNDQWSKKAAKKHVNRDIGIDIPPGINR